jgi:iron complex outermembrane receptor protein
MSASAQYIFELASGTITPRLDFAYRGAVYYRQFENPLDRQGAYTRTDLRVRYDVSSTPVWFELYVQNLEDNDEVKTQVDGHLNWPRSYWLAAPRTFGARFGFTWSGDTARELLPF